MKFLVQDAVTQYLHVRAEEWLAVPVEPRRTAAQLAHESGVSAATISYLLGGKVGGYAAGPALVRGMAKALKAEPYELERLAQEWWRKEGGGAKKSTPPPVGRPSVTAVPGERWRELCQEAERLLVEDGVPEEAIPSLLDDVREAPAFFGGTGELDARDVADVALVTHRVRLRRSRRGGPTDLGA